MQKIIYTIDQINVVSKRLVSISSSKTLCFYGEMGVGKTTLIKALVKELGGADTVSSPTFGIVNEYHDTNGSLLSFHFDFYRLNDENEALDLGFEDYLNQNVWVFIEWPEKIPSFLPDDAFNIHIEILNSSIRKISF